MCGHDGYNQTHLIMECVDMMAITNSPNNGMRGHDGYNPTHLIMEWLDMMAITNSPNNGMCGHDEVGCAVVGVVEQLTLRLHKHKPVFLHLEAIHSTRVLAILYHCQRQIVTMDTTKYICLFVKVFFLAKFI